MGQDISQTHGNIINLKLSEDFTFDYLINSALINPEEHDLFKYYQNYLLQKDNSTKKFDGVFDSIGAENKYYNLLKDRFSTDHYLNHHGDDNIILTNELIDFKEYLKLITYVLKERNEFSFNLLIQLFQIRLCGDKKYSLSFRHKKPTKFNQKDEKSYASLVFELRYLEYYILSSEKFVECDLKFVDNITKKEMPFKWIILYEIARIKDDIKSNLLIFYQRILLGKECSSKVEAEEIQNIIMDFIKALLLDLELDFSDNEVKIFIGRYFKIADLFGSRHDFKKYYMNTKGYVDILTGNNINNLYVENSILNKITSHRQGKFAFVTVLCYLFELKVIFGSENNRTRNMLSNCIADVFNDEKNNFPLRTIQLYVHEIQELNRSKENFKVRRNNKANFTFKNINRLFKEHSNFIPCEKRLSAKNL